MTYLVRFAGGPGRNDRFALSFIIFLASVVVFSFSSIPTALAAGARNNKSMTREQRAANVKRQVLEHQRRMTPTGRKSQFMSPSTIQSGASVQFNKLVKK